MPSEGKLPSISEAKKVNNEPILDLPFKSWLKGQITSQIQFFSNWIRIGSFVWDDGKLCVIINTFSNKNVLITDISVNASKIQDK